MVGDGTSTSTILAHAILADGVRNVVAGASAIDLKRGLDRAARATIDALHAMARPVKSKAEKAQVATISAHNDPSIGALVADALENVGGEGVISVEESKTTETTLDVVEGMKFHRGFLSPYFVTDADRMDAPTEAEMKSKKEALDDAISSTKAAVAEGIVPGGGLALLRCVDAVSKEEATCEGDERTGVQILKRALEAPARQIAENSAADGGVVVARMLGGEGNFGFDASRKTSILSRRALSIRPKSYGPRSKTPSPSQAFCS